MGFLDKLKLTKKDVPAVPPPPAKPEGGIDDSKPDAALPPLPTSKDAAKSDSAPAVTESSHAKKELEVPKPAPQTPEPTPQKPLTPAPQMHESVPDAPAEMETQDMPEPPKELPKKSTHLQPPEALEAAAPPPSPTVPPPPAPSSRATRKDIREHFGDMDPIKVDPREAKGMITSDQVDDLDVSRFRLPGEEDKQFAPAPAPFEVKETPNTLKSDGEHPFGNSSPSLPEPSQAPAPSAFSGPLYVDVKTYEEVQSLLGSLKSELDGIGSDVDDILKIKDKEDKEFSDIVKRLEKIQDKLLSIDEDLFEQ